MQRDDSVGEDIPPRVDSDYRVRSSLVANSSLAAPPSVGVQWGRRLVVAPRLILEVVSVSNRCFLVASNAKTIYPSFAEEGYNSRDQLIASDVNDIPLLWLALFREADLRKQTFNVGGDRVDAMAPLCLKEKALEQLQLAIPHLQHAFPALGSLEAYAAMMHAAIKPFRQRFLSIELEEIGAKYPSVEEFNHILTLALRGFDARTQISFRGQPRLSFEDEKFKISIDASDGHEEYETLRESAEGLNLKQIPGLGAATVAATNLQSHAQIVERMSSIRPSIALPPVRMYLDDISYTDDEQWNLTRTLGAGRDGSLGWGSEVPWEKENADFGWKVTSLSSGKEVTTSRGVSRSVREELLEGGCLWRIFVFPIGFLAFGVGRAMGYLEKWRGKRRK